jgi:hypothetical protein
LPLFLWFLNFYLFLQKLTLEFLTDVNHALVALVIFEKELFFNYAFEVWFLFFLGLKLGLFLFFFWKIGNWELLRLQIFWFLNWNFTFGYFILRIGFRIN